MTEWTRGWLVGAVLVAVMASCAWGQIPANEKYGQADSFRQIDELLPSPNAQRTASGAPGEGYWQQKVDYVIDVEIDDENQRVIGRESIVYHNNSPHTLRYLWVQIDNNIFGPSSDSVLIGGAPEFDRMSFRQLHRLLSRRTFDGSVTIKSVTTPDGGDIDRTINGTMMRVELDEPLEPGQTFAFEIAWEYQINNADDVRGRTAAEFFEEDGNWIYEMAHWYPRLAAYTDYAGWVNKQFLGRGEFTLEFGDYLVRITVPEDHIVASTGVLQNPEDVLTDAQRERLEQAKTADKPMFVVTPEEAEANESSRAEGKKTWVYKAENVRDFAFASSRKFIWDAWGRDIGGNVVMAMSYWPNEGEPLWSRYSTQAVAHTLEVYSKHSFDYPYPVAISVNGPVGGMEYPMICFNGPRPEEDGTYTKRTKYGLIGVIIHEVGHFYYPMIVNSDERQWTWMDEGVNTFVQLLAQEEWEDEYPSRRGHPSQIVGYMTSENQVPIMTNSESILQFGANAYAKPATALNILRETVMGRELFDYAFKEYSRRWMFKRPTPADLFRSLEDASAVDLDWFWRGWFYTTGHVDQAVVNVEQFRASTEDPDVEKPIQKAERDSEPLSITALRNADMPKRTDQYPYLLDFYNEFDELDVTPQDREKFQKFLEGLGDDQKALLGRDEYFYVVTVENVASLVMPVIMRITFEDGTEAIDRRPAEVWRQNNELVRILVVTDRPVRSVEVDPFNEIADADESNNIYPPVIRKSRFEMYKQADRGKNPMQLAREAEEKAAGGGQDDEDEGGEEVGGNDG